MHLPTLVEELTDGSTNSNNMTYHTDCIYSGHLLYYISSSEFTVQLKLAWLELVSCKQNELTKVLSLYS